MFFLHIIKKYNILKAKKGTSFVIIFWTFWKLLSKNVHVCSLERKGLKFGHSHFIEFKMILKGRQWGKLLHHYLSTLINLKFVVIFSLKWYMLMTMTIVGLYLLKFKIHVIHSLLETPLSVHIILHENVLYIMLFIFSNISEYLSNT